MENQNTSSPGPNLSQYFVDDPPSFFDEIAKSKSSHKSEPLSLQGIQSQFKIPTDIEIEPEDDIKVSDDVRNYWEYPHTEPGIPPLLTTPKVMSPSDLTDPIREAVQQYLSENEWTQRKVIPVDGVTQDERGLRSLIAAECFRSAVNLTSRLLTIYGQGYGRPGQPAKQSNTPHSLQLWFTRLTLLAKLRQYELLQLESEPFDNLNRPDVFYEFYPEMHGGKKGSMACFSFRLALAEIPLYTGSAKIAMDRLTELLSVCIHIEKYFSEDKTNCEFWRRRKIRILHSIMNCAMTMKDYILVDDIMKMLISQPGISREGKRSLFSAWGRIYLQIGDVFGAEQKFSEARRLREMHLAPDLRDLIDKGLIAVAQNDFQEAFLNFQKALQQDPSNTMLLNNMGVSLLYCGKLKDAIALLDKSITLNPQKSLNEHLLVNLSTLYELESTNSKEKKLNLLRLVNKFKPDLDVSLEYCLKLQSNS